MHQVIIENAIFHAAHGVYQEEQSTGGKFEVNLTINTDFSKAADDDELEGTINYAAVYDLIADEMAKPSKLIEHLAQRIINRLKSDYFSITHVELKISKHNPPISGEIEKVSVKIEESFQDLG